MRPVDSTAEAGESVAQSGESAAQSGDAAAQSGNVAAEASRADRTTDHRNAGSELNGTNGSDPDSGPARGKADQDADAGTPATPTESGDLPVRPRTGRPTTKAGRAAARR